MQDCSIFWPWFVFGVIQRVGEADSERERERERHTEKQRGSTARTLRLPVERT